MASKDLRPQFVGQWDNLLLEVQLILHLGPVRADKAGTPCPDYPCINLSHKEKEIHGISFGPGVTYIKYKRFLDGKLFKCLYALWGAYFESVYVSVQQEKQDDFW